MGFKKRVGVIVKSQFNDWVSRAEDPEKILNQAVEEMEEGLEKARVKIGALRFRIDKQAKLSKRTREQIGYWQERAEDYVGKGMDENAREAVRKRRILEEKERRLGINLTKDRSKLRDYEERYAGLENRVQAAKTKRTLLLREISLAKGAPAGKEDITGCPESLTDEPFSVFRKIEERVEEESVPFSMAREKEKEAREREEKLIAEEVEMLKKNINKGGGKK